MCMSVVQGDQKEDLTLPELELRVGNELSVGARTPNPVLKAASEPSLSPDPKSIGTEYN